MSRGWSPAAELAAPALGFSGRHWFVELHRRRRCWVSSLLLDVPPLPLTAGPACHRAAARRPWLKWAGDGGDSVGGRLGQLRAGHCQPDPADTGGDDDRLVLQLEPPPTPAGCGVSAVDRWPLPGDEQLSEVALDPDGGLLPSRLTLPPLACPLLPTVTAEPPPPPQLPRPDRLSLRDLQDPLLDPAGRLLCDDEFTGWETSAAPAPGEPWGPAELPQPDLSPLQLPQLLCHSELSWPGDAAKRAPWTTDGTPKAGEITAHRPEGTEQRPRLTSPATAATHTRERSSQHMPLRDPIEGTDHVSEELPVQQGASATTAQRPPGQQLSPPEPAGSGRPLGVHRAEHGPSEMAPTGRPQPASVGSGEPAGSPPPARPAGEQPDSPQASGRRDRPDGAVEDATRPLSAAARQELNRGCTAAVTAALAAGSEATDTDQMTCVDDMSTAAVTATGRRAGTDAGCDRGRPALAAWSAGGDLSIERAVRQQAAAAVCLTGPGRPAGCPASVASPPQTVAGQRLTPPARCPPVQGYSLPPARGTDERPTVNTDEPASELGISETGADEPEVLYDDKRLLGKKTGPAAVSGSAGGDSDMTAEEPILPPYLAAAAAATDGGGDTPALAAAVMRDGGDSAQLASRNIESRAPAVSAGSSEPLHRGPLSAGPAVSGSIFSPSCRRPWDDGLVSPPPPTPPLSLPEDPQPPAPAGNVVAQEMPSCQVEATDGGHTRREVAESSAASPARGSAPPPPAEPDRWPPPAQSVEQPAAGVAPCRPRPAQSVEQPAAGVAPCRPRPAQSVEQPAAGVAPCRPRPVQSVEQPAAGVAPCRPRPAEPIADQPAAKVAHITSDQPGGGPRAYSISAASAGHPGRSELRTEEAEYGTVPPEDDSAAGSFVAALSARVRCRAERGRPARLLLPAARPGRRAGSRQRPAALDRALARCGLPTALLPRPVMVSSRAVRPDTAGAAESGVTELTEDGTHTELELQVTPDEVTLRCLSILSERAEELLELLDLGEPFSQLPPEHTRLRLKQMCNQVNESLPSLERQGLLRQYRHTLAVHGLAKSRQLAAHLSTGCCLSQLAHFTRTHADILQGCLGGAISRLEATLSDDNSRLHPRVTALRDFLAGEAAAETRMGPVLIVTEPYPELLDELTSALAELTWARPHRLSPDEPQHRLQDVLRAGAVLVLGCGPEPPPRWPLAGCRLVVPLLAGGTPAAGPLLSRCRAARVATLRLTGPTTTATRQPPAHGPLSPSPPPPPQPSPPSLRPRSISVVACAAAAERWDLHRLAELSGRTVTVYTRDYSQLCCPGQERVFPDLVVSADTCLLLRPLSELVSPADGERLAAGVRCLREQAAVCWLLLVGRSRAAATDTDSRREEAAVSRLRGPLAAVGQLPEYTVRVVRANRDSLIHIVLDILRDAAPAVDTAAAVGAVSSEEERHLLRLPGSNAVSAGLLLRRAGGLAQLRAAPLGRLVQLVPELPVRLLAALQRPLQTADTSRSSDFVGGQPTEADRGGPQTEAGAAGQQQADGRYGQQDRPAPGPVYPPSSPAPDPEDGQQQEDDWLRAPEAAHRLLAEAGRAPPWSAAHRDMYDDSPPMEPSQ